MFLRDIKLNFYTPMHIGEKGIGVENSLDYIHSDTIYSAIYISSKETGVDFKDIRVTSAFPFVGDILYFYVPPLNINDFDGADAKAILEKRKLIKSTRFVDKHCFEDLINRGKINWELFMNSSNNFKESRSVSSYIRPRVALDRITKVSSLFYSAAVVFNKNCGLHFLVDCDEDDWKNLKVLLKYLGDKGLGGMKSCGFGRFVPEFIDAVEIKVPDKPERYVSLSLIYPDDSKSFKRSAVSYRIIDRRWWTNFTDGNAVMYMCRMLGEGAIFKEDISGKILVIDVKGKSIDKVYRYGLAFNIPAREASI